QEVYNVTGELATIREAAAVVRTVVPDADLDVSDEGELPWTQDLDDGAARADLGYEPAYDLESGIREYVEVLRNERGP
ncbi:MAG: UDP-glucose 4-epimerase, partial [Natronomonas sp.]